MAQELSHAECCYVSSDGCRWEFRSGGAGKDEVAKEGIL